MSLLTTFLPKQHKNSNILIKILITYIFWEGRVFETPDIDYIAPYIIKLFSLSL